MVHCVSFSDVKGCATFFSIEKQIYVVILFFPPLFVLYWLLFRRFIRVRLSVGATTRDFFEGVNFNFFLHR